MLALSVKASITALTCMHKPHDDGVLVLHVMCVVQTCPRETIAIHSGLLLRVTMVGLRVIISPPPRGNIRALATISRTLVLPALWSPTTTTTCKCVCVWGGGSVVSKYFTNMHLSCKEQGVKFRVKRLINCYNYPLTQSPMHSKLALQEKKRHCYSHILKACS